MLEQTTFQQTELKVAQDIDAMSNWIVGAQDHCNRQARTVVEPLSRQPHSIFH